MEHKELQILKDSLSVIDKKDFQANDPREKQHADNRKLKLQREVKK